MQIHKPLLGFLAWVWFVQSAQAGPDIVSGRARLVTHGYSRGCQDAVLLPVSADVEARFASFGDLGQGRFVDAFALRRAMADNEIDRSKRQAGCAGDGSFLFRDVPPGQYLLIARVTWSLRWARHGGYLVRKITAPMGVNDLDISVVNDDA